MAELGDTVILEAQQHVDDIGLPEALAGAVDARQRLLRGDRAVEQFRRLGAGVAIAAGRATVAEIGQEHLPAAACRLGKPQQRVELLAFHALALVWCLRFLDEAAAQRDVLVAVEHQRVCGQAVAPGPAGLLIVGLDAARQVDMRNEAHVWLVDAHAEGDGGDHDHRLAALEARLVGLARGLVHAGVIGERVVSLIAQPGGGLLGPALRQAVDDAALALVALQEILELRARIVLFLDGVADVGAVEARDEGVGFGDLEMRQDFRARRLVGRCRQRHARGIGKARHHRVELAIGGAEIVAPLR